MYVFMTLIFAKNLSLTNLLIVIRSFIVGLCAYAFLTLIATYLNIGLSSYPYIYNIFTHDLGSSVFISNFVASGLFFCLFYRRLSGEKSIDWIECLSIILLTLTGLQTGSRTFLCYLFIFLPFLFFSFKLPKLSRFMMIIKFFWIILFFIFMVLITSYGFLDRLNNEGLHSQRFEVWREILSEHSIFSLGTFNYLDTYNISAFHNIFLDLLYIYGPAGWLLIFFYLLCLINIYLKLIFLKGYDFVLGFIFLSLTFFLSLTTVVPRGDYFNLFISLSIIYLFAELRGNQKKYSR